MLLVIRNVNSYYLFVVRSARQTPRSGVLFSKRKGFSNRPASGRISLVNILLRLDSLLTYKKGYRQWLMPKT